MARLEGDHSPGHGSTAHYPKSTGMWQRPRRTGVNEARFDRWGVDREAASGLLPAAGIILVVVSAEVAMMTSFALRRVHRTCNAT